MDTDIIFESDSIKIVGKIGNGITVDGGEDSGVTGTSQKGLAGVHGKAMQTVHSPYDICGVLGESVALSPGSTGVRGKSTSGDGIHGSSQEGYGGHFEGFLAPLRLEPSNASGPPTTDTIEPFRRHMVGELYVDNAGVLYFCTASGTPANPPGTWTAGTWKRVQLV
jgi:hypothetical protein